MRLVRRFGMAALSVLFTASLAFAQASLVPDALPQYFDSLGHPLAGGSLTFDAAGTTTPQAIYADSTLATPLTNPVVLDSAGRPTSNGSTPTGVYLSAVAYKIILKDSGGVTIRTQDNVYPPSATAAGAVQASIAGTCGGRLTLTTGVPVTTADVTAATTLYDSPYKGAACGLYDGTQWNLRSFTERSIAVPATTSQMYDVFLFDNAGTATLELLAWTNDTTRATALVLQDGVLSKSGALTRRYVGSFRTTGVSGQTEDSATKRYVWNYYNRVRRALQRYETTSSWTYSSATTRQANGSASNQVDVIQGLLEAPVTLTLNAAISQATSGAIVTFGIAQDSTTTFGKASSIDTRGGAQLLANVFQGSIGWTVTPSSIGRHFFSWNEQNGSAAATTTWEGAGFSATIGLDGWIEG